MTTKTTLKKLRRAPQNLSWLLHLLQFVKCWQFFFLELNCKRLYLSSGKEKESRRLVFTSSIKRGILRRSRAVTAKKMYKKEWCRCRVVCLFLANLNLLLFWSSRWRRRRRCLRSLSTLTVFPKHENNRFSILSIYVFSKRFWDKQEMCNHIIAITFHSSVLLWSFKWKLRNKTLLWCCWWYCEYHIGEAAKAYFLWRPIILSRADTIVRGPGIFPGYKRKVKPEELPNVLIPHLLTAYKRDLQSYWYSWTTCNLISSAILIYTGIPIYKHIDTRHWGRREGQ